MRHRPGSVSLLGIALTFAACSPQGKTELNSFQERASYAVGLDVGSSLIPAKDSIDIASFVQGLTDALEERDRLLTDEQVAEVMRQFVSQMQQAEQERMADQVEVNLEEGSAFREEHAMKSGVTTTESGLQIEVLVDGTGASPSATDQVTVHYVGTLVDGSEFDSSRKRGVPATFPVNGVIAGWTEALQMMSIGGTYRLVIPPELGYGSQGSPPLIGPNATLVFEVELIGINE